MIQVQRSPRAAFAAAALALAAGGCSGGGGSSPIETRGPLALVPPKATPSATPLPPPPTVAPTAVGDNLIATPLPGVAVKPNLFVFLPGSGAKPSEYTEIVAEAANRGYDAIGLSYHNGVEIAVTCKDQNDDCPGFVRAASAVGGDVYRDSVSIDPGSPHTGVAYYSVAKTDSVEYLLNAAIKGLGWSQFLANGDLVNGDTIWSDVILSGHSQGGGTAAFIGRNLHTVARVCFFSDPNEPSATWLGADSVAIQPFPYGTPIPAGQMVPYPRTDPSLYWALTNDKDTTIVPAATAEAAWKALSIPEPVATGVTTTPPVTTGHQWVTSSAPKDGVGDPLAYHDETAVDSATPDTAKGSGIPALGPVWDAMCFK